METPPKNNPKPDLRPTERFSNRVENYIRYRPGYPSELLDCLRQNCGLTQNSRIADVGSGTGKLAELFLEHGSRVFGIEPNDAMREAGERLLSKYPNFSSVAATAEATSLESQSMDFVIAGQAFHWFNRSQARQEFERILKPRGWVVLVWNERLTLTPFLAAYEEMLQRYSKDYEHVDHRQITGPVLTEFYHPGSFASAILPNRQRFDFAALKGRLLSSSYVPVEGETGHEEALRALSEIFERHAVGGVVGFEYETKIYYGRLAAW